MPQSWYGQHGPAATAGHPSQSNIGSMHLPRFHQSNAPAPGPAMAPGPAPPYSHHRSSPPIGRPSSVASTSSSVSYPPAPGPDPGPVTAPVPGPGPARNHHQGHGMSMNAAPRPSGSHPGHVHHHGGQAGIRPMGHGRYPMPPRNGTVHAMRPMARGSMPSRLHHGVPPPPPPHMGHSQNGPPNGQPLRPMPNSGSPHDHVHNGHSQFGPKHPTNALMRSGPMHHPVPYRRMHPMAGPANGPHGYHHNRRNSYSPMHHHQMPPQLPDAKYQQYSRPAYGGSPDTVATYPSLSRSPSPPPAPPSAQENLHSKPPPLPPIADRVGSEGSANASNNALRERQNVQETKPQPAQKPAAKEDATADAASILLQLSAVIKQDENAENKITTGNQENQLARALKPGPCRSSFTTDVPANMIKPIEESTSIDEVSTAAHSEADSAPDLTSEPSCDSIDQPGSSDFPAKIPDNFPTRLALPFDDSKLNSLHCFLRSELLEIFVVRKSSHKSPTHSPGSSVGRVGLRCVHCALVGRPREDRDEAPMAVFYPKSVAEIYRLVTSWQRCHLRKCRNLPPSVRSKWTTLRENDKSRGKTHYWITSAKEIGLIDCHSRAGGILFGPETNKNNEASPSDSTTTKTTEEPMTTIMTDSTSCEATNMEVSNTAPAAVASV
jgi:hypothetical protein